MNSIKNIHIEGYKKFQVLDISFNENMNILVGENESGKSTVIEAINIVLNLKYKNSDKSILKDLFNIEMVKNYKDDPSIENLPFIYIELELDLLSSQKQSEYFFGENNITKKTKFGIAFECIFDEVLGADIDVTNGKIPYEYYQLKWYSFSGLPYNILKKPFEFIFIDTSETANFNTFNYFNKTLFNSVYDDKTKLNAKNVFREQMNGIFEKIKLDEIDDNRKFGINDKKVILESILSVYENEIPLENKGSGMESLIKTQIALDKSKSKFDLILIEEPENHLCFTNMNKMINEISLNQSGSQIIVTTHSNMVASRLNLHNIIWVKDVKAIRLKNMKKTDADFFVKALDNSFLQILLSEKIILVEGPTEYLLVPKMFEQIYENSLENEKISIISCNGISYKRYLELASRTNKRISVITDNDKKQKNIEYKNEYNLENDNFNILQIGHGK